MSGRYLLDTNIVIALWANDATVTHELASADEVFVPIIVLGELHYGARKSAWSAANIARIDDFAAGPLPCEVPPARALGKKED